MSFEVSIRHRVGERTISLAFSSQQPLTALVERGEAPLGVVYATDALASDKVEVVRELPESSHPPIRYPVAILAASESPDAAGFLAFLSSAKAKAIFEKHGFGTVE